MYNSQSNQSTNSSLNPSPRALTPVSTLSPTASAQSNRESAAFDDRMKSLLAKKRIEYDVEIDKALEDNKTLLQQDTAIKECISSLEREKANLLEAICAVKSQIESLQHAIDSEQRQDSIDVDQVLIAPNPMQKQLLETIADDQALEDCLYALAGAFRGGSIDLGSYMKSIRTLSAEQFLKRSLAIKIHQKLT